MSTVLAPVPAFCSGIRESLGDAELADFDALADELIGIERLGVAYSGGVDSALLLAVAAEVIGRARGVARRGVAPSRAAAEPRLARAGAA
ncbi:MAG: hypothetical protein PUJ91_05490, partial [Schaalia hyovaginalis]|nr:hypothetical protein [Schaalia hyovaginalis]